jgi:hypothetical protein
VTLQPTRRALPPKLFAYTPRERWVGDAPACDETLPIKEGSVEGYMHQNPPLTRWVLPSTAVLVAYSIRNPPLTRRV